MRKLTSILALTLSLASSTAHAAGLLSTNGEQLAPLSTHVTATADEQVLTVVTELAFQTSASPASRLVMPISPGSSVVGVEVLRNGAWEPAAVSGKDATAATDPGGGQISTDGYLSEWLTDDSFSIDLPPLGETTSVRVTTLGIAGYDQGKIRLRLPLADAPGTSDGGLTTIDLRILSDRPFAGYAGEGGSEMDAVKEREGERHVLRARYEGTFTTDFAFSYGVVEAPGLWTKLLTHHERCEDQGFFLLMVRPPIDTSAAEVQPRAFQFVMDRSGSMAGAKMEQARQSAAIGVSLLTPGDTLNVIAFDTDVSSAFPALVPASPANRGIASSFIEKQMIDGGTNISDGLLAAVSAAQESDRSRLVVFLTDGQPTAGIVGGDAIVRAVKAANQSQARIYAFGIGSDVNKPLLKNLAVSSGGEARFLSANADLSKDIGAFLTGISSPVLVDATTSFSVGSVVDSYPDKPQDLFAGRQLLVLGRYAAGGKGTVSLSGTLSGAPRTTTFPVDLPACAEGAAPFLPRLWAKTKIDALLARLAEGGTPDPVIVAQIEELSQQYGIESPYASYGVSNQPSGSSPSGSGPSSSSNGSGSGYTGYASGGLEEDDAALRFGLFATFALGISAAAYLATRGRRGVVLGGSLIKPAKTASSSYAPRVWARPAKGADALRGGGLSAAMNRRCEPSSPGPVAGLA